jgi:hypothetical protein
LSEVAVKLVSAEARGESVAEAANATPINADIEDILLFIKRLRCINTWDKSGNNRNGQSPE